LAAGSRLGRFPALRHALARPGVLEVEFTTGEELLGRLYELVQMAAKDLGSLDRSVMNHP